MAGCFKRICAMILAAVLFLTLNLQASAAETDTKSYIQQILNYYIHYQEAAQTDIDALLSQMAAVDWQQAVTWEKIVDNWSWVYSEMELHTDILPDGLPEDDSLCIVVLGYRLNSDGSVKQELEDRLEVALRSAEKYPEAYILCTGGATSDRGNITEAQVMAKWLSDRGVADERIILEDESMSTTENARNTYRILCSDYPQIQSIAIVTSDYHVYRSAMMFNAVSIYESGYEGSREIEVVSNAVCASETESDEGIYMQAWGLAILAGVEIDGLPTPELSPPADDMVENAPRSDIVIPEQTEAGRQGPAVAYAETETLRQENDKTESAFSAVLTIAGIWLLAVLLLKWRGYLH